MCSLLISDHIDYIKKVAGIDHVGLGSDYDGVPRYYFFTSILLWHEFSKRSLIRPCDHEHQTNVETWIFCLSVIRVPVGLEDVSTYPKLVEELLRRGYSDEEASKVVGKNLITAMEKMEQVNRWPQNHSPNCHDVREQDFLAMFRLYITDILQWTVGGLARLVERLSRRPLNTVHLLQYQNAFVDDLLKNETIILLNVSKYYLILGDSNNFSIFPDLNK